MEASEQIEQMMKTKAQLKECLDILSKEIADAKSLICLKVNEDGELKMFHAGKLTDLEVAGLSYIFEDMIWEIYGKPCEG